MTLPDLNIATTPIYESLVATRGNPYQIDGSAMSTDYGAADGQAWVAVVLVGGCDPLAVYQALQSIQGLQYRAQPWPQPAYDYQSYDPVSARMASTMAAGIVRNALQASSPSGYLYDQYANQPDLYAASALSPAMPANPVMPQPEMGMAADPAAQYAAMQPPFTPAGSAEPTSVDPVYFAAPYEGMGQPAYGSEPKQGPANGRFGRIASAVRELRGR